MASERAARLRAPPFIDPPGYARHRPEATRLYQLVERHYAEFVATREAAGRPLPQYVQEEFEAYLKCGRFEHGFLRVRCEDCRAEKLVAFSCKGRGFCPSCGARRMTESAALLADEVLPSKPLRQWVLSLPFALRFLLAINPRALTRVLGIVYRTISAQVLRKARLTGATGAVTLIQRFGSALNLNIHFHMLVLDGAYLSDTGEPVFRRIAQPSRAALQALVERLAERIGRSLERLALTAQGQVRYRLKSPYRDGTTHIVLEPLDFMARLAALVPPPRAHLTRFHGVFAPHAALRAAVTPAGRGSGAHSRAGTAESRLPRHVAMTWARRLQRVFAIEIEHCARCGGRLRVISSIEEPALIARILAHRRERGHEDAPVASLGPRTPPPGMSGMLF